jgi:hypothetical protein
MSTEVWPLVDEHDDGIRPAGGSDVCFFCKAKVGQPHGSECVIVTKRIEMAVKATFPDGSKAIGKWIFDEPHSWDAGMSEFSKNESSWCAGNILHHQGEIAWVTGEDVWSKLEALHEAGDCLCNVITFQFERVVDDTPKRELQMPGELADGVVRHPS